MSGSGSNAVPSSPSASSMPPVKRKTSQPLMFGHMFPPKPSMTDLRRRALTLIDVVNDQQTHGPLVLTRFFGAAIMAFVYVWYILPVMLTFGVDRWRAQVDAGNRVPKIGGFYAEVQWTYTLMLSLGYVGIVYLGVKKMEGLPPVRLYIFETMAVYNCLQCMLNLFGCVSVLLEVRRLGFRMHGNESDVSSRGHTLGSLIWLQYHIVQLQLFETIFMIARKRFQRISFFHIYLHVLNLWGWYFACRYACGGDTYFPTLITSGGQTLVYLYFSLSLLGFRSVPLFTKARVTEVQIARFILCALHNIIAAVNGDLPIALSGLHLFVIVNGLILYTDFDAEPQKRRSSAADAARALGKTRLSFSFDSCGWLYCYHFGVAHFLQEHILRESSGSGTDEKSDTFPDGVTISGSSGGALVACILSTNTDVREAFNFVLHQYPACHRNPLQMFNAAEAALRKFNYSGACKKLSQRCRVLVTRVSLGWPFIAGEVVDTFPDDAMTVDIFRASCHVPILAGVFPKNVGGRYYYDGLAWTSLFVPWRGPRDSRIVKITALSAPLSHIRAPLIPFWWAVCPPPPDILRGMYWRGYQDAAVWFTSQPEPHHFCGCRQRPRTESGEGDEVRKEVAYDSSTDDPEAEFQKTMETWRAARSLLRKTVASPLLPEKDPSVGSDVQDAITKFESMAERGNSLLFWAGALIAPLFVAGTYATLQL